MWEWWYAQPYVYDFGDWLDNHTPLDPAADLDGDGRTNAEEEAAGTDPYDNSVLKSSYIYSAPGLFSNLLMVDDYNDEFYLVYHAVDGKYYNVEWSGDLVTWNPEATDSMGYGYTEWWYTGVYHQQGSGGGQQAMMMSGGGSLDSESLSYQHQVEYEIITAFAQPSGSGTLLRFYADGNEKEIFSPLDLTSIRPFAEIPTPGKVYQLFVLPLGYQEERGAAATVSQKQATWYQPSHGNLTGDDTAWLDKLHLDFDSIPKIEPATSKSLQESGSGGAMMMSMTGQDPQRFWRVKVKDKSSDADLLNDYEEALLGTDMNDEDSDGDSLNDDVELVTYRTDPAYEDTDDDGLKDGEEVNTYLTDPNDWDSDADGMADGWEVQYSRDPLMNEG